MVRIPKKRVLKKQLKPKKTQENSKCRICGKAEKKASHVLSECSKLAQKEYKRRHDWFGTKIHLKICRKYGIKVKEKWYKHKPEVVVEDDKDVWDVTAQTDHEKYRRRSDVIAVQKNKNLLHALMMEEWIPKN